VKPATLVAADSDAPVEISILVLSYNTRDMLMSCLESVASAAPRRSFEVVCVDDCSSDGSAEMVASELPWVRLAVNPRNSGYAAANNVGFSMVRGERVLLLNSDVEILDDETFDAMADHLDRHPDVGVVGQRLHNPDGTVQISCRRFPSIRFAWRQSFLPRRWRQRSGAVRGYYMADFDHAQVAEVEMAAATCCMFRREILDQVGGMDEAYFLYVGDADWFWRIRQAGWKTHFLPDHPVIHHGGLSADPRRLDLVWDFHRGLYRYYRKHLAAGTPIWLRPLVLPGICLRFCLKLARMVAGSNRRVCSDDFK
jgi:GT2 family glycosyltransferase